MTLSFAPDHADLAEFYFAPPVLGRPTALPRPQTKATTPATEAVRRCASARHPPEGSAR